MGTQLGLVVQGSDNALHDLVEVPLAHLVRERDVQVRPCLGMMVQGSFRDDGSGLTIGGW
jgi:hypothetical protein